MSKNLYNEYVIVSDELDVSLKKCFVNHLLIYNYSLSLLYQNNELTFKTLKKQVLGYIENRKISPIFEVAIFNELYYQYKKFKRNIKVQKLITDIQYFTFLMNGYNSRNLIVSDDKKTIKFINLPGEITLEKELPEINEMLIYMNISFSNNENKYKLSLYKSN